MKVSVIIVNYNTNKLTRACIKSVLDQTKLVDFEIILVDNASTDYKAALYKEEFPSIKLVVSAKNLGFAKGNNLGIEIATGEYLLLLNSDTVLVNDAVSMAAQRMQQDKNIGVLSGKLIYPNGAIQPVSGRFPSLLNNILEIFRAGKFLGKKYREQAYLGNLFDHEKERMVDWVWGAFFMIPRTVLEKFPNKKLHDDFFMYYEDVQWCYAVNKLGYKVLYYPEPLIIHFLSGSDTGEFDREEKYRIKILPNQFKFLMDEKGKIYSFLFYFTKSIYLLTLSNAERREEGKFYFRYFIEKFL